MKQKLLTDIELDVHELKYLMDSFSKEPTQTLSELLKRSVLRMKERLDQLSEEVDTIQITTSAPAIKERAIMEERPIPFVDKQEDNFPIKESDTLLAIEEPVVEVEKESVEIENAYVPIGENRSPVAAQEEFKSSVLGESIKISTGLRQSISLNDTFRFTREVFEGDSELMNRMVEQISVMGSYKMAVAFLASKVNVSEENEAMNDFLELLKKYFNQSA